MTLRAVLVLLATLAFALSPVLSPGFPGFTADQFPVPQVSPPIQPPGLTFALIWTVIYAWLIVMALFGLLKRKADPAWDASRPWVILTLAIGAAWIPVANLSPVWATVLIWMMLGTAQAALYRVPARDRLWLEAPLGLYTGWLTAASCVATAIVATGYGASPEQAVQGAFLILAAWLATATVRLSPGPRPFYLAGLAWGLLGIIVGNLMADRLLFAALAAVILIILAPLALRSLRR
ncbi:tryptophan-rich sensory protein [Pseudooceanicola sp. CBS1P-1]|uniref:Tryptophan-rich sensory protein n=1 Tax=Pseudooceanicola albus TaxID=2692189 RepID=A0A6L7G0C2_9RHOB|nr:MULTISPECIES: tryptophan-rich sensory protein [Pseudooceanicola]MBT9382284.1 tryptophan-rich sensory protein [Pseudooceanicola endophyticus]MXN16827.1 hypothetical protein [Pseudooceanicola albus]